jgi:hypothetical protein
MTTDLLQIAGVSAAVCSVFSILAEVWRPYLAAYLGKKGERLANAEDIAKILTEVRFVTAEAETIKARVSAGTWERQTLWNKRVEVYSDLFDSVVQYGTALNDASAKWHSVHLEAARSHDELVQRLQAAFENLTKQQVGVISNLSRARLFAGPKLDALLAVLYESMNIREDSFRDPSGFQESFGTASGRILAAMRIEIEFGPNHGGAELTGSQAKSKRPT